VSIFIILAQNSFGALGNKVLQKKKDTKQQHEYCVVQQNQQVFLATTKMMNAHIYQRIQ